MAIDTDTTAYIYSFARSRAAPEWFPVIQHRRARPQIICILSRRSLRAARRELACNFSLPLRSRLRVASCSRFVNIVCTDGGGGQGNERRDSRDEIAPAARRARSFRRLKNFTAGTIVARLVPRATYLAVFFRVHPVLVGPPPLLRLFFCLFLSSSLPFFPIRPARGARRCRDWNTYARKSVGRTVVKRPFGNSFPRRPPGSG